MSTFVPPVPDPAKYPALSASRYNHVESAFKWGTLAHLHEVIKNDDVEAVKEFMRLRPDLITWEDRDGRLSPPLVEAARLGRDAVLTALLDYRDTLAPEKLAPHYDGNHDHEDPGQWGTPLTAACMAGHLSTVQLLLARLPEMDINERDNFGYTPLLAVAARDGQPRSAGHRVRIIRLLMNHGADPGATVETSLYGGNKSIKGCCHGASTPGVCGGNALALAMAITNTDPAVVMALIEAGVNLHQGRRESLHSVGISDKYGDSGGPGGHRDGNDVYLTPLAIGALHCSLAAVATLLSFGAAPDLTATAPSPAIAPGCPVLLPLHAAMAGRTSPPGAGTAMVSMMSLFTADDAVRAATINATFAGHTPLHLAARFDRLAVVRALLDRGADPKVPTPGGASVLLTLFASIPHVGRGDADGDKSSSDICLDVDIDESIDIAALVSDLLPRGDSARRIAAVNEADADGNTALHFAAGYGLRRARAALLTAGARVDICNRAGQRPVTPPPGQLWPY